MVIPTRGDVDLGQILANLLKNEEVAEIIIEVSGAPYGRYTGARIARCPVILTQDDDCITDVPLLVKNYRSGVVVNLMSEKNAANYDGDETLVGYGAIFDRALVAVLNGKERDAVFLRECDRVFTALNKHHTVIVKSTHNLPSATADNRMYRQKGHADSIKEIRKRIAAWKASR